MSRLVMGRFNRVESDLAVTLAGAMGLVPAPAGAAMAALIHAAGNAARYLTHFHLFFMPGFARPDYAGRPWQGCAVERFTALEGSAQRRALQARAELAHITGLLAGKGPQKLAIRSGGMTRAPGAREKAPLAATLRAFRRYLQAVLFGGALEEFAGLQTVDALLGLGRGDVGRFLELAAGLGLDGMGRGSGRGSGRGIGRGSGEYLSFGAYPLEGGPVLERGVWDGVLRALEAGAIVEDLNHAWMRGEAAHPRAGWTEPDGAMVASGYSWCKAPRLAGLGMEVGALARRVVDGHPLARALARCGVLARVAGRLPELSLTPCVLERLVAGIVPGTDYMDAGSFRARGWSRPRRVRWATGCESRGPRCQLPDHRADDLEFLAARCGRGARSAGIGAGRFGGFGRGAPGLAACGAQFRYLHGLHGALMGIGVPGGITPPDPRGVFG